LPWSSLEEILIEECIERELRTERNCIGYVKNFGPELQYMYENTDLTAGKLCALFDSPGCGDWDVMNSWFVEIPAGKPDRIEPELPPVRMFQLVL